MKNTRTAMMTLVVVLALALVWMAFLMITASPLAMTCIPAAALCGACAIGIAKLDERGRAERTHEAFRSQSRAA